MVNGVYDQPGHKHDTNQAPSDDDLRNITGIGSDQEGAMDREATNAAAREILGRENAAAKGNVGRQTQGLTNPNSNIKRGGFGVPNQPETSKGPGIIRGGFGQTAASLQESEDSVGKGYTGDEEDDEGGGKKKRFSWQNFRKKKLLAGGILGATGLIGGAGLFSLTVGPLQFVHLSEMLLHHDFSSLDNKNDDMTVRLLRYAFFAKQGHVERTRLNALKNKFADKYEARLESVGLKSAYTQVFGFLDGYVIDRRAPEFRDMTDQELVKHVKETYGYDLIPGKSLPGTPALHKDGIWVIDTRSSSGVGRFSNIKILNAKLQESGLNKVVSALGTNLLRKRAGITLHPIKQLDSQISQKLEDAFQKWRKTRNDRIKNGALEPPTTVADEGNDKTPQEQKDAAANTKGATDATVTDASNTSTAVNSGSSSALSDFQNRINSKWSLGGQAALSIPCLLRGIDDASAEIKKAQVILPLIRMGTEAIAVGQQAMSGQDIDLTQLGWYDQSLNDNTTPGNHTSWTDSNVIQTISGSPNAGVQPSDTLKTISGGTPFSFLNKPPLSGPLDTICSPAVQGALLIITFAGGPISAIFGTLAGAFIGPPLLHLAANWLSGNAVNIAEAGAAYGSNVAFGSRLAADQQGLASGETIISKSTEKVNNQNAQVTSMNEFNSKSLASRLFDPTDYRTPVGQFIDKQNTSTSANIASLMGSFLNIGNTFSSSLLSAFSGHSSAASDVGFVDYPWQGVGPDPSVDQKAAYQNPYDTPSSTAQSILEGPNSQAFIDKAMRCNGDVVDKDTDGNWNVTTGSQDQMPLMSAYTKSECARSSDPDWEVFTQWMNATIANNGLACVVAGDAQSCTYAGAPV